MYSTPTPTEFGTRGVAMDAGVQVMTAVALAEPVRLAEISPIVSSQHCSEVPTANYLDIEFDCVKSDVILRQIVDRSADAPFVYIVTPNVDHVVRLHHAHPHLRQVYRHAWATLCDSRILAKLAASDAIALPVTTGSDLTAALCRDGIDRDARIAIVGGDDGMIDALRQRYGFTDIIHFNPPMGFINDADARAEAAAFIVGARARYTFLAVGSPQQELLAHDVATRGEATGLALCVGASLEFLAGSKRRAPRVVQALSLEWLFRLATDPGRLWRRYMIEAPQIFLIARRWRDFVSRYGA